MGCTVSSSNYDVVGGYRFKFKSTFNPSPDKPFLENSYFSVKFEEKCRGKLKSLRYEKLDKYKGKLVAYNSDGGYDNYCYDENDIWEPSQKRDVIMADSGSKIYPVGTYINLFTRAKTIDEFLVDEKDYVQMSFKSAEALIRNKFVTKLSGSIDSNGSLKFLSKENTPTYKSIISPTISLDTNASSMIGSGERTTSPSANNFMFFNLNDENQNNDQKEATYVLDKVTKGEATFSLDPLGKVRPRIKALEMSKLFVNNTKDSDNTIPYSEKLRIIIEQPQTPRLHARTISYHIPS